jgi:hypothetical protein
MRRKGLLALPVVAGIALAALGPGTPLRAAESSAEPAVTHVDRTLGYRCQFLAGERSVDVRVTADVPATGAVGSPVRPAAAGLTVSLAGPALADLTGTGAAAASALVRFETTVSQQGTAATATWSGARTDPVPVPGGENPVLALDVPLETPPPVVSAAAGEVSIAAGSLTVVLTGYTAAGTVTEPPSMEVSCTLAPGQPAVLAVITMSGVDSPGAGAPAPPGSVVVGPGASQRAPRSARLVEIPADCHIIEPPSNNPTPQRYCANVTGFANVAKLDAAVKQPMGIVNIGPTAFYQCAPPAPPRCQQANLLANHGGRPVLPAADASFLPFGFVPTTGTMQLTQIGLGFADIFVNLSDPSGTNNRATITGRYSARLFNARVNGVPLDLGPNCRTAVPIEVELRGKPPEYLLTGGGPLSGTITIPPFRGCGVREDLDPLITGLVSGGDNFVKLTQGSICTLTGAHGGCPPEEPIPET